MDMNQMQIGAGYIRVSTGKQEELSPDSQKRLIIDYAKKHNIIIPDEYVFIENGISGRKADKRPQFQKMIGMAKAKQFQVILLWKFSRFARNQEESIVYKSMLKKNNVDVISISEPLIEGPFGTLIERIIEWMDEFYSIRLAGDVTRGMTEKALRGGYQARPPLGYTIPYHNAVPQIVPEEAEIVKIIFDDYVNKHLSIFQIAKKLNSMGLRTSHNKQFEKRSIEYILENPCYTGNVRWNRTENATNAIKDKSEWIVRPGKHNAIISEELYAAAKLRRETEYKPKGQRPSETYKHWLSGIIKCSACDRTLIISGHKNRYGKMYYSLQCYGYSKGKCLVSHSISVGKIEPIILDSIKNVLDIASIKYKIIQPDHKGDNDLKIFQKQLDQIGLKEKRIKAAYAEGIDTIEEYKENKKRLLLEREEINQKLNSTPDQHPKEIIDKEMLNRLQSTYDILTSDAYTIAQKNESLKGIVEKIIFNKENMHINIFYYYVPSKP